MQSASGLGRWGSLKWLVVGLPFALAFATPANATLLFEGTQNIPNNAGERDAAQAFAEAVWGPLDPLGLLCKDEGAMGTDGSFCGVFDLDPNFIDGTSITSEISWDLSAETLRFYVAVTKAANPGNFYVVQDLAQLTAGGPETLDSPTGQGISHVSFYGLEVAPPEEIPEPHTLALLGIGLLSLGVRAARRGKN